MGIALGYNIALPFCKRNVTPIVWVTLQSDLIIYRKGIRAGKYVIDKSINGGITWETNLISLLPGEDTIIIAIDNGVEGYRHEVRGDAYCIDAELTATGFDGVRGIDWENIFIIGSEYTLIKFGALYNWYAATDVREIANIGWHVPTIVEYQTLSTFLGGDMVSGAKLKCPGFDYWSESESVGTNESGFGARGNGARNFTSGDFQSLMSYAHLWTSTINASRPFYAKLSYTDNIISISNAVGAGFIKQGCAIRLIKDSTTLSDGETGTYTGNDGKVYRTICIGTQEWLADNLAETKYRDGTDIPIVTDNGAWAALATGAMCYYNNDINNALM